MSKSGTDLLKYVTERTVKYLETPKIERKQHKLQTKETWRYRWFGMLPLAIEMWLNKRRAEK